MQMDSSEYQAIKETLSETKDLAKELGISLPEALQIRQLVAIRWLCNQKANE